MATEQQPSQGQKVEVWTRDGRKVFEGTVVDVLVRAPQGMTANGKATQITIKEDAETSDTP